jgi:hypothetical protein
MIAAVAPAHVELPGPISLCSLDILGEHTSEYSIHGKEISANGTNNHSKSKAQQLVYHMAGCGQKYKLM